MGKTCCVCNCEGYPGCGLSFFRFPNDASARIKWLKLLGMGNCQPKSYTTVCSKHFNAADMHITISGMRRLKDGAMPTTEPIIETLQDTDEIKACRVCLVMDCQLYALQDYQLGDAYCKITGIGWDDRDSLPQHVCWECAGRLTAAYRLFQKALKAHRLLLGVLSTDKYLSVDNVRNLKRSYYEFNSSLLLKHHEPNECDLYIQDDSGGYEDIQEASSQTVIETNELANFNLKEEEVECNATEDLDVLTALEFKEEQSSDQFYDENDDFFNDSDDNLLLSEVAEKTEKKNVQVKSKEERKVKEKMLKVPQERKKVTVKRSKDDENPISTMNKFYNRKPKNLAVDESLFDIRPITYEEQEAAMEARRTSAAYENSPHGCGVCYRAYKTLGRYNAHMLKHSAANGEFECFICKFRLKTDKGLRTHMTSQHTRRFHCKNCSFVVNSRTKAYRHQLWHAVAKYECRQCSLKFDNKLKYMKHLKTKHVSDISCELCGFAALSKHGMVLHKLRMHRYDEKLAPLEGPHCDVCDITFMSQQAHDMHLVMSSRHADDDDQNLAERNTTHSEEPSTGPVTSEQPKVALVVKSWTRNGEKRYKCPHCEGIFATKSALIAHVKVNHPSNGSQPGYECPQCGKHFTFLCNMRRHALIHTGQKPHECEHCGRAFGTMPEKRKHIDHVHLKVPYPKREKRPRMVIEED